MENILDKQKEIDLQILRKVEYVSDQKSLADELGFSVGKVNYILKALIKKGLIKAERFAKSENKKGYRYLLTKKGFQEKIELTHAYIKIKKQEYEELERELSNELENK